MMAQSIKRPQPRVPGSRAPAPGRLRIDYGRFRETLPG